eukprot:CAMPEP_0118955274 /NCGR_PEP_ID=MMETSP1169-20130426/59717_1 /TAXON_ID=36882 /ORGANISM="Pyramimonas obovata, Strain CCMP722" /LENGTH=62 /DNA_ID=CAMNT_0006903087 /DNA_START=418 /DNA_END=606 /DNA_ORIENTATION=+
MHSLMTTLYSCSACYGGVATAGRGRCCTSSSAVAVTQSLPAHRQRITPLQRCVLNLMGDGMR